MNRLVLSGKIGSIVAYKSKSGKQVFRNYTTPKDPKTPKQLAHRMKFGLVNRGLSPLNNAIKLGHRDKINAYRSLVGKAYHEAIMGEYPNFRLDYSKIKIAEGKLQLPPNVKFDMEYDNGSVLFSWNKYNSFSQNQVSDNDLINIVALNVKHNVVSRFLKIAKYSDCKAAVSLPANRLPDDSHFWAYFSSHSKIINSDSVYIENPAGNNRLNITSR